MSSNIVEEIKFITILSTIKLFLYLFDACHCGKGVRGCVSEYYESSNDHVGNVNMNRQFSSAVVRVKTVD